MLFILLSALGTSSLCAQTLGAALGGVTRNEGDIVEASKGFDIASRVPLGQKIYWYNKRTGNWGTYCPIKDGHSASGDYCRAFKTTVHIDKGANRNFGAACRCANGTWYAVEGI